MAIVIKAMDKIASKWKANVATSVDDYQKSIPPAAQSWYDNTMAAKERYVAALQASFANDSFAKGLAAAGQAKWASRCLLIGATRWVQGVATATPAYIAGFTPYRDIIAGLTLPPRYETGNILNYERVKVIGQALHARKIAGGV